jgi:transcriptional regulator with XRE-family HTH domain
MADRGRPSVRRRSLAAELKRLREERNLTGEDVALTLTWSTSKISRIENSRIAISEADLGALLEVYEVPDDRREELLALVRAPKPRGWWEAFSDILPEWYAAYIRLEAEAQSIRSWSAELVNGLLQTAAYAQAVMDAQDSAAGPDEASRRVQIRLKRQQILTGENPTAVTVVLDESVLLRRQGSDATMAEQLDHLIQMSFAPNVRLHVLPLDGVHPVAVGGGFSLLNFAPVPGIGPASNVVYVEQYAKTGLYVEDELQTREYRLGFDRLLNESLDQEKSRELIERIRRDRWS